MRRETPVEPVLHPEADQEWFRGLAPERQEELHAVHRRSADHDRVLVDDARRRLRVACLQHAALFALIDVCCPGAGFWTFLALAAAGAGVGAALHAAHASRVASGSLGLLAFVGAQVLTRGGITPLHFFWCFILAASAALLALRREFGD